jgi:aminoglycoside phosphotransferase family enzyme
VNDQVNHPSHYTSGNIECIDAIEASMTLEAFKGYLKGNCTKYLYRYEKKQNQSEDLKKCRWYLEKLISIVEEREVEMTVTDCFADLCPDNVCCFLTKNSCADG